ncbi:MAG: helix-turn-helix domain-containing protein [Trueperaceae bacterium]|nr:helix-turn-helix domain-containing protein [Trueperaceae bacterium]
MNHQANEPSELQAKRLDRLAERIKQLPEDRQDQLMGELNEHIIYSVANVAELFDVDVETVRRWIRADDLQAAKVGKGYRISRHALATFWRERGGGELFEEYGGADVVERARWSVTDRLSGEALPAGELTFAVSGPGALESDNWHEDDDQTRKAFHLYDVTPQQAHEWEHDTWALFDDGGSLGARWFPVQVESEGGRDE